MSLRKTKIILWNVTFLLLTMLCLVMVYFNLPGPEPTPAVLGITFSARYAEGLGLDPRETLSALLDDIGVRHVRLPAYWDEIEAERGRYDYARLDWQVEAVREAGGQTIITVGQRVPRWPECFIPEWAREDDALRQEALLQVIERTVTRYRTDPSVTMWQVENEPFLTFFGICPDFDKEFLDREIALVKKLDPERPVLATDSGELSLWFRAAKRGDVFGTTLYRKIWKDPFGYVTYPIGPNFFLAKEWLVRLVTHQENFIVIELQAEPWVNRWIGDVPLDEQFLTMDERQLRENLRYAEQVGFPAIYLWGAEWWYWLKTEKHYPAVWDTARELFRERAP